jgi:uncharacterized membrane protein YccC
VLLARPSTFGRAMPLLFGICGTLALLDTRTADMVSFANGMLSQVLGLTAAAVFTSVFRRVGAAWTARRILRAGWRDLAQLSTARAAAGPAAFSTFSARMVDRVGLLSQRLAATGSHGDLQAFDALRDLRVGLNMTLLQGLRRRGDVAYAALAPLLAQLGRHFARRPRIDRAGERDLLASLDGALRAVAGPATGSTTRAETLAALTGMRRDLFPQAAPWQPAGVPNPMHRKETR